MPGRGAARGDGEPARHPRRRALVVALAGAVLAVGVAIPWALLSSPGAPAAKIPARAQAGPPASPFATLLAPAGSHAVESAVFRPGTVTLAAGMYNGDVDLWNTTTRKVAGILHRPLGAGFVAFGPGGATMAVGEGGDVFLWDTAGKAGVRTATLPTPADVAGQSVTSVAFGPGGVLAVAYSGGGVYLWDTATRKTTATLAGPAGDGGTTLVAFGPGGVLAAGYSGGDVYLWDTATGRNTATLTGPPGLAGVYGVSSVAFGPGGATMAVGYDNGDVHLWDTATDKATGILLHARGDGPGTGGVSALAFGPGGILAVGAATGAIYLWHVRS